MRRRLVLALLGMQLFATPALAATSNDITADGWRAFSADKKVEYVKSVADGMYLELYAQMSLDGNGASKPGTESAKMRAYIAEHPKAIADQLDKLAAGAKGKPTAMRELLLRAYFAAQPDAKKRYEQSSKANAKAIHQQIQASPAPHH